MPRLFVKTTLPSDCIFRFRARTRREGGWGSRAGVKITIPASVVRGLRHLGWGGGVVRVVLSGDDAAVAFLARTRKQGACVVIALPKGVRGNVMVEDWVDVEVHDGGD